MRTRIIVSALFLWGLPLLSPVMRAGDHDAAISVAVNNMVRHEKRFLSTTDVFDIGIYPEQNLLIVSARVDDDYHNHFSAVVSPKDTSIIPVFIKDKEKLVWVSPSTKDTIIMVPGRPFYERYPVYFSPEEVRLDYSDVPNQMLLSNGKLFVWRDDSWEDSTEVIDALVKMNRLDFIVPGLPGWTVDNDGEERVCYDLDALREGKIKKFHHYGLWGKGFRAKLRRGWFLLWHPQRDEDDD